MRPGKKVTGKEQCRIINRIKLFVEVESSSIPRGFRCVLERRSVTDEALWYRHSIRHFLASRSVQRQGIRACKEPYNWNTRWWWRSRAEHSPPTQTQKRAITGRPRSAPRAH